MANVIPFPSPRDVRDLRAALDHIAADATHDLPSVEHVLALEHELARIERVLREGKRHG
jgi:hypothetical protein